ncbi:Mitochondrial ribosomal protein [Erysiphe neolycopersici]|uniref:Mitochondrial ribosomal protein n=1 Tax=Erysiphe neolycopersici TaxID=212602 RepID=A0A420HSV1_9PEZI|nr:Mitochondrial ribosomal protein [Erysiphe neolycopersici]
MKSTQTLSKRISRLSLTTKQTNKGFYKGTGSGSMGEHTKHGGFIIKWNKLSANKWKLTPFVTKKIWPRKGKFDNPNGAFCGKTYLARWKIENGTD